MAIKSFFLNTEPIMLYWYAVYFYFFIWFVLIFVWRFMAKKIIKTLKSYDDLYAKFGKPYIESVFINSMYSPSQRFMLFIIKNNDLPRLIHINERHYRVVRIISMILIGMKVFFMLNCFGILFFYFLFYK